MQLLKEPADALEDYDTFHVDLGVELLLGDLELCDSAPAAPKPAILAALAPLAAAATEGEQRHTQQGQVREADVFAIF